MKAFELTKKTRMHLANAHPFKERHGDELVQAITLSVRMEASSEHLEALHEGLRDMLFWNKEEASGQVIAEGVARVLPDLRCPIVKMPLQLDLELTGYTVTIDYGLGPDRGSDLELYGCKLSKFKVEAIEGGSAAISWTIGSDEKITPELVGALCGLAGSEIELLQVAPKVAGDAEKKQQRKAAKKQKEAEAAGQQRLDAQQQTGPVDALKAAVQPEGGGDDGGSDSEGGHPDAGAGDASKAALDASGKNPFGQAEPSDKAPARARRGRGAVANVE